MNERDKNIERLKESDLFKESDKGFYEEKLRKLKKKEKEAEKAEESTKSILKKIDLIKLLKFTD